MAEVSDFESLISDFERANKENERLEKRLRDWIKTLRLPDKVADAGLVKIVDYLHGNLIRVKGTNFHIERKLINTEDYFTIKTFMDRQVD